MKMITIIAVPILALSACTPVPEKVTKAEDECAAIGYDVDLESLSEYARIATLQCIERGYRNQVAAEGTWATTVVGVGAAYGVAKAIQNQPSTLKVEY